MRKKENLENLLLKINGDDLESRLLKAEILFKLERLNEALAMLQGIDLLEGFLLRYKILLKIGKVKEAVSELQKAIEVYPYNHYVHFLLAKTEERLGNLEIALEEINRSLEIMSISTKYLMLKSKILFEMGNYEESLLTSTEVIKNNPDNVAVRIMRILSYYNLGARYDALMEVNKALEYSKDHYLHFLKGKIYYELGHYALAIDEFKIAIYAVEKPEYLYYISLVLYIIKKYNESLVYIEKALDKENKPYYLALKAKILWELRDENARKIANKAINMDKSLLPILKEIVG